MFFVSQSKNNKIGKKGKNLIFLNNFFLKKKYNGIKIEKICVVFIKKPNKANKKNDIIICW